MGKRKRMSSVDTAWLRMDSPGNLMMIVGVYEFEGPLDLVRMRELLQQRFLVHRRFRSCVAQDPTGYYWEEADDFDLDLHLVRTALPGAGTIEDLKRFVGRMASTALDPSRPLWQMQIVDNYRGGQAMVVRIHHCIADGIALIGVLLGMTSQDPVEDLPASEPTASAGKPGSDWDAVLRPLTDMTVKALGTTGDAASRLLSAYSAMLNDPDSLGEAAGEYARIAGRLTKDAAAIALMEDDSATSLKGVPSGSKVVAWNEPLALDDVKAVGRALGCSVNDVLLASVAGAIRSYLVERGEDVAGCELRAMVPVNLRDPRKWRELGNKFGLVPLLLPVGIESPIARVFEVRKRMNELKSSYTAVLTMGILGAVGLAPRQLQKQALDFLSRKGTAVMTNVPGPQQPLYMAGATMRRIMVWVPQSGAIGVGVSILSYAGGVQFGLITDKRLCPEPQKIIDRFEPEFEKIVLALCMLPWDGPVDADEAQNWLFPAVPGPGPAKQGRKRTPQITKGKEPQPPGAGQAQGKASKQADQPSDKPADKPAVKPPGVRARRSAFSAARQAE